MKARHIAILGSTGSIGTQALEVIQANPERFVVSVLTAHENWDLLAKQARAFLPNAVVISNEDHLEKLRDALSDLPIKVYAGSKALSQVVQMDEIDMVLTALVGFAGLKPTLAAIEAGKHIALANKETLVVAGEMVMQRAKEKRVMILPVDSEHSAIFQCLAGENYNPIEKIILTASGGPFRGFSHEQLKNVTLAQALKHPNWEMGAKITVDSASMMNKGLEVIEAKWLFDLTASQIEIVVHPQSILHSAVQFEDGSIKAQLGLPDMKLPIQYALGYPQRVENNFPRFSFFDYPNLTFEKIDTTVFRNLQLAFDAMEAGGVMPCILNAANEEANLLFRKEKISFLQIAELNEKAMQSIPNIQKPNLEMLLEADRKAREFVSQGAKNL